MAGAMNTKPWPEFVHQVVYAHPRAKSLPVAARHRIEAYFLFAVEYQHGGAEAFLIAHDLLVGYELVTANKR